MAKKETKKEEINNVQEIQAETEVAQPKKKKARNTSKKTQKMRYSVALDSGQVIRLDANQYKLLFAQKHSQTISYPTVVITYLNREGNEKSVLTVPIVKLQSFATNDLELHSKLIAEYEVAVNVIE
jgi:hypothetical protein